MPKLGRTYATADFDPSDQAFLQDLHSVWDYGPGDAAAAVNEAHAMCALPPREQVMELTKIVRIIDPDGDPSHEPYSKVREATGFMKVASQHFCPSH
jgi:hypothetical protein